MQGLIATFLASAATLYIIGDKLPAVSFLTPIDKLVVATMLLILVIQFETM